MALKFYSDQALTTEITTLTTQHANTGMAVQQKVYIANKDAAFRYESVTPTVEDANGTSEVSWVALAPDSSGSAGSYGAGGASLSLGNITDNVGHPFWVKITTPAVGSAQNKTDLQLKTLFREFAV